MKTGVIGARLRDSAERCIMHSEASCTARHHAQRGTARHHAQRGIMHSEAGIMHSEAPCTARHHANHWVYSLAAILPHALISGVGTLTGP